MKQATDRICDSYCGTITSVIEIGSIGAKIIDECFGTIGIRRTTCALRVPIVINAVIDAIWKTWVCFIEDLRFHIVFVFTSGAYLDTST